MREVIAAMEFDSASCALGRNQREEVIDAVGGRGGWSTRNLSNMRELTVKMLEDVGGFIGRDIK